MRATRLLAALSVPLLTTVSALAFTAAPAAASDPCSGLGAPIPNTSPTQYWNGCVRASAGLNVRQQVGVGWPSTNDAYVTTLPYNTRVQLYCYMDGQTINGTPIWDAIGEYQVPGGLVSTFGPSYVNGVRAYDMATDAYIYTGSDSAVVPYC